MNYTLEIKMYYKGVSPNIDGSVTKTCKPDVSDVKFITENVGGGRRADQITGKVIVSAEYDDFATYLNDTDGYYVYDDFYNGESGFSYKLWRNGTEYTTNKIKLVANNIELSRLTFELYGDIDNEYTKIYSDFDSEYNIIDDVTAVGNTFTYADFRTASTSSPVSQTNQAFLTQESVNTYIDEKIAEFDYKIPSLITFTHVSSVIYTPIVTYVQFEAVGYLNGTTKEPPAGINWKYDSMVSGQPKFIKKPGHISTEYGTLTAATSTITNATINIEQEADIDYSSCARRIREVIEYLIGEADSTIQFDGNSFLGFDNLVGAGTGSYSTNKFLSQYVLLVTTYDMMPTLAGNQKNNLSTRGYISMNTIMSFLEQLGFFWYLEDVAGTYYFRLEHIKTVNLGSSNPDIEDYFNRNYTYKTRNYELLESKFDIKLNSTLSSDYNFRMPEYRFTTGTKKETFQSDRIITDVNYVVDAKENVFDTTSGNQWVLLCTTFDGSSTYDIRAFTSGLNSISTSNYELSFYWMIYNIFQQPGKFSEASSEFPDNMMDKRKTVEIEIPMDNPFEDFDMYDYVSYFGEEAEIISIEMGLLNSVCKMKLKYL